jgi:hypothetical protein
MPDLKTLHAYGTAKSEIRVGSGMVLPTAKEFSYENRATRQVFRS